jgi:hypothetical protein
MNETRFFLCFGPNNNSCSLKKEIHFFKYKKSSMLRTTLF